MSVDIVAENARTQGRTSFGDMNTSGAGDVTVAGFARTISKNVGETIQFSVDGPATQIWIYRMGWYGGQGFRQVAQIPNTPTTQPEAVEIPGSNGGTTCTAWSVTASWAIPSDACSGIYFAMIRNAANTNAFYAVFVVRDDAATADFTYKTSDSTWGAAYNHYGKRSVIDGKDLYGSGQGVGSIQARCHAVSYHRPVITRRDVSQTYVWACEMPMIRWMERQGYSIKYTTSVDLDKKANELNKGKIFLSVGHDEYWSENMRNHLENWRDSGPNKLVFLSGNEVLWKTRYVYNGDEATMWCFKDTMPGPDSHVAGVPLDPVEWTGSWRDTRWPQRKPEWLLTGTHFGMNGVYDYDGVIPVNPYSGHRVWGLTSLVDAPVTLTRVLGFEADHKHPTQPEGSYAILAAYTRSAPGGLSDDNGENYNIQGNLEWGIVSQRYLSGAVTVGFGTCQWAWSLDGQHDRNLAGGNGTDPVSVAAQQFTQNLFQDLGANPATMHTGLQLQSPATNLDMYGVLPDGTWVPPDPTEDPDPPDDPGNPGTGDPGSPVTIPAGVDGYFGDGTTFILLDYNNTELDLAPS